MTPKKTNLLMVKTIVVAGAGVVGLSIARAAARCKGLEVFAVEANKRVGMETSSRNSEVIHAGIYYQKDSLKAQLCVHGRDLLYAFCEEYSVPHKRCGKLIVAHGHQLCQLEAIQRRGVANGVSDLRMLSRAEAQALEPQVECDQALLSPSTGIIDSHAFMQTLQGDAEAHGAAFAFETKVESAHFDPKSKSVRLCATTTTSTSSAGSSSEAYEIECDYFVNATGIFAPSLFTGTHNAPRVPAKFAKGTYFKLGNNCKPFSHLVYPIPEVGGLGVHATVDLEGNVRFGPDVEWVSTMDFTPDQRKADAFADRIRPYWPHVSQDNLWADYCGIRPKIEINGQIWEDFYIAGEATHGMKGVVHLCGIESPGLTSSLAIAETVVQQFIINER